jgi:TDG/mug DNA glycosylase family protein
MQRLPIHPTRRKGRDLTPWKPTREQIAAAYGYSVGDLLHPGLRVLFCGINPSLYSAAVGHHFARPGNRFWPALYRAGFTDQQLSPFEERLLLQAGCGITNLVVRATASAEELTPEELAAGARVLTRKVRRYKPRAVAFLGIGAFRLAYGQPKAALGRQAARLDGAECWVLPNPSGLNANHQLADLARLYGELRRAVAASSVR